MQMHITDDDTGELVGTYDTVDIRRVFVDSETKLYFEFKSGLIECVYEGIFARYYLRMIRRVLAGFFAQRPADKEYDEKWDFMKMLKESEND